MLVLSRYPGEKIQLSNGITISIEGIEGKRVMIGVEAPRHIDISRSRPCVVCRRPSFDFYLGYGDIPFCGKKECAEHIRENDKSLFK